MEGCCGDDNYWFVAYTMKEYKKMTGDNEVPKQLKGDLRKGGNKQSCSQQVCWLAYHNSQQHSQPDNEMVLVVTQDKLLQSCVAHWTKAG